MQVAPVILVTAALLLLLRNRVSTEPDVSIRWPIDEGQIQSVGQSVMADRDGHGRPHKGIDIFAASGTVVRSAIDGKIIRVVDGRSSTKQTSRDAGLWVDIQGKGGSVYRYLHLEESSVTPRQIVRSGDRLGTVARANTSGLGDKPHLHFEIRASDYTAMRDSYGEPLDPLLLLPKRSVA